MKDERHNKPATEQEQEFDSELQAWYKLQAQEQPGRELDDDIIKMATEASAINNQAGEGRCQPEDPLAGDKRTDNVVRVEPSFWRSNRWAISSAASVMLVVAVIMLNPHSPEEILSDDALPMMLPMNAPLDEQPESLGSAVVEVEPKMMPEGEIYGPEDRVKVGAEAPSHLTPSTTALSTQILSNRVLPKKRVPQREAVVSAKQALNHLQNLIDSQQWGEAETLANNIAKRYPNLEESEHPQNLRWNELQSKIAEH